MAIYGAVRVVTELTNHWMLLIAECGYPESAADEARSGTRSTTSSKSDKQLAGSNITGGSRLAVTIFAFTEVARAASPASIQGEYQQRWRLTVIIGTTVAAEQES